MKMKTTKLQAQSECGDPWAAKHFMDLNIYSAMGHITSCKDDTLGDDEYRKFLEFTVSSGLGDNEMDKEVIGLGCKTGPHH